MRIRKEKDVRQCNGDFNENMLRVKAGGETKRLKGHEKMEELGCSGNW